MAASFNFKFVFSHPAHFLAAGLGSGLSPKAPGTVGTAVAVPLWVLIAHLPAMIQPWLVVGSFLLGVWLCDLTSRNLGEHDHGGIVWDEFVGYWVTMMFIPTSLMSLLVAFVLFRFFDIIKPWPIKWLDKRVDGGFGIMIDDVLAGVFAGVLSALLLQVL